MRQPGPRRLSRHAVCRDTAGPGPSLQRRPVDRETHPERSAFHGSTRDDVFFTSPEDRVGEIEQQQAHRVVELADALQGRVVLVEPLDMQPLPKGTPILKAILARRWNSVSHITAQSGIQRGLLDSVVTNDHHVFDAPVDVIAPSKLGKGGRNVEYKSETFRRSPAGGKPVR